MIICRISYLVYFFISKYGLEFGVFKSQLFKIDY
jgi:hypothetical protein